MVKKIIKGLWGMFYLISTLNFAATPDFGLDVLKDLDIQQTKQLVNGGIVFTITNLATQEHSGLIEAAVIFNQAPEQTWNLLYRTEDHIKYLKELEEVKVIARSSLHDTIEFIVRFAFLTFTYRANLTFDKAGLNFFFGRLDPSFNNDLIDLRGFWRFYPYGEGKTLARYGCAVSLKNIPTFIEDMVNKSVIARSLVNIKKYVDSGGEYGLSEI